MADEYFSVAALPEPGGKTRASFLGAFGGGMAGNVARIASGLGLRCAIAASVGDDRMGDALLGELTDQDVSVDWVSRSENVTGRTVITLLPDGERTIALAPGDHVRAAYARIDTVLAAHPRLVYTSAVEVDDALRLARACGEAGVPLVCDIEEHEAVADPRATKHLESLATIAACNAATAALLGPRPSGVTRLVLAGAKGLSVISDAGDASSPSPPVEVIDTTGGGDGAVAACCAELLRGGSAERMASAAVEAASHVVTRLGVGQRLPI